MYILKRKYILWRQKLLRNSVEVENSQRNESEDVSSDDEESAESEVKSSYKLTRDRIRRNIKPPLRYRGDDELVAFDLTAAMDEDSIEPHNNTTVVTCSERKGWKAAIAEELQTLERNKT